MKKLIPFLAGLAIATSSPAQTIDDVASNTLKVVHATEEAGLEKVEHLAFSSTRGTNWLFLPDSSMWVDATDFYDDEYQITEVYQEFTERFGDAQKLERYSVCTGDLESIKQLHAGDNEFLTPNKNIKDPDDFGIPFSYARTMLPNSIDLYILCDLTRQRPEEDAIKAHIVSRLGILTYGFTDHGKTEVENMDEETLTDTVVNEPFNLFVRYLKNCKDLAPDLENPNTPEAIERRTNLYSALSDSLLEFSYRPF